MTDEQMTIALVRHSISRLQEISNENLGIVQCQSDRCPAVYGQDGLWRDATARILPVTEIIQRFSYSTYCASA